MSRDFKNAQLVIAGVVAIGLCSAFYFVFSHQNNIFNLMSSLNEQVKHVQDAKTEVQVIEKVIAQQPWAAVQDKIKNAVVQIIAQTAEIDIFQPFKTPTQNGHFGTGFFISEREIITNAHVADKAQFLWIKIPALGKAIIDVELVGISHDRDLALLRVTDQGMMLIKQTLGTVDVLPLGNSDLVRRVDEVLALGYPLGQSSLKSTTGIVSGREHIGGRYLIQMDAPINPGSSGGPAMNLSGQVIGIANSGIVTAQNIGYIIPVNELKMILDDLRKTLLLKRPLLGVKYNKGSQDMAEYLGNPLPGGCYVIEVYEGAPLSKAGIKPGDMLYEINGHKVDLYGDLNVPWTEDKISIIDYVAMLEIGQKVNVVFYRKGKKIECNFAFEFSTPIPVREVYSGYEKIEYEIFGGMLIQPLTLNHIPVLINNAPGLAKYLKFSEQMKPALVVTHVVPNSQAQRLEVVAEGSVIEEINGQEVTTLDQLRKIIRASAHEKFVRVKTSDGIFFVLSLPKSLDEAEKLAEIYKYPVSPFIKELLEIHKKKNARA